MSRPSVAIVGRPNVGKSTLVNRIARTSDAIVHQSRGVTRDTRDAIDTVVERDGKRYRMVDTAGIRKKSTVYENIEYYSMVRGLRAIDRADVALLVVDASTGVTEQDQKVAHLAIERGCAGEGRSPRDLGALGRFCAYFCLDRPPRPQDLGYGRCRGRASREPYHHFSAEQAPYRSA